MGDPSLKSGALGPVSGGLRVESLKRVPRHPFKAPGLQAVKRIKITDAPGRAPISLKVLLAWFLNP